MNSEIGKEVEKEIEPHPQVTFVFRGENPFMKAMVDGVRGSNISVNVSMITHEVFNNLQNALQSPLPFEKPNVNVNTWAMSSEDSLRIVEYNTRVIDYKNRIRRQFLGDLQGVVITDETLYPNVRDLLMHQPIRAYTAIESQWLASSGVTEITTHTLSDMVRPIANEIMEAGKKPKLCPNYLDDHLPGIKLSPDEERTNYPPFFDVEDTLFGRTLKRDLGLEAINYKTDDLKKVVILTDHHIYDKKGIGQEIALICLCCVGLNVYADKLIEQGYKLYPLKFTNQLAPTIKNLVKMIEQTSQKQSKA
jgi:hypothetical protein